MQSVNDSLAPFRKIRFKVLQSFGHLDRAPMAGCAITTKQKKLTRTTIGISQHCAGRIAVHVKTLQKLENRREEFEKMPVLPSTWVAVRQ